MESISKSASFKNCTTYTPPLYNEQTLIEYLKLHNLLFARWIDNFDCGYETEWYHVIKDEPFDITALKAKRRYEINKGLKNYRIQIINPKQYTLDLYKIIIAAYSSYPRKYRPKLNKTDFFTSIESWSTSDIIVLGAFDRLSSHICGFVILINHEEYISYSVHKVMPSEEKKGINAALVFGVMEYFNKSNNYKYVTDGERAIRHETQFQDYLMKYFGFRRAYCRLKIVYNPYVKAIVYLLYPFRKVIYRFNSINFLHNIYSVLEQERIRRSFL